MDFSVCGFIEFSFFYYQHGYKIQLAGNFLTFLTESWLYCFGDLMAFVVAYVNLSTKFSANL